MIREKSNVFHASPLYDSVEIIEAKEDIFRCSYCGCIIPAESGVLCDSCRKKLSKESTWTLLENGSLEQ